mgnify:FL=1
MTRYTYKVNIMPTDGTSPFFEEIEATNPPQARKIAENRYAGVAKIGSANQVGGG